MEKAIYFDMDGTIANLYGVPNWLEKIEQSDISPYEEATVLLNMQGLAHRLNALQKLGYTIGIISWLSKSGTPEYNAAVAQAKLGWLKQHLGSVKFDEIHITAFGVRKSKVAKIKNGIIFDDNPKVRREWIKNNPSGWACSEKDILEILSILK
jgi:phosphoserine phosphatase